MKLATICLVAALCVALAMAQTPKPCTTPFEWTGYIAAFEPEKKAAEMAQFTYDALRQRTNTFERVKVEGQKHMDFQFIALFSEGIGYEINLDSNECKTVPINSPFVPIAIPSNATFVGTASIGGLLDVNVWEGEFADQSGGLDYWRGTVTSTACIPVSTAMLLKNVGPVFEEYFDVVIGIENPAVFIPPSFCSSSVTHTESSPFNRHF